MTVSHKRSRSGAYYINCSTVDDYYSNDGAKEPPGEWHFSGGEEAVLLTETALGLKHGKTFEAADTGAFAKLCQGFNPRNSTKLTQNAGEERRLALHDFTFSQPKTFSVVWSQADQAGKKKMQAAHKESVKTALEFFSRHGPHVRRGAQGKGDAAACHLITALYEHGSSRADDPQLHIHATVLNVGLYRDPKTNEIKSGAIETKEMMRWQGAMASIYHADLAWRFRQMGAAIRMDGKVPELEGVPTEVVEAFSQRRKAIEAAVEKWQADHGMTPDADRASRGLLHKATIETRDAKGELTRDELEALWLERGAALGFTAHEARQVMNLGQPAVAMTEEQLLAAARQAVTKLTETSAVFAEPALVTAVAVELCGKASPEAIEQAVTAIKQELVCAQVVRTERKAVAAPGAKSTPAMVEMAQAIEAGRLAAGLDPVLESLNLDRFSDVRRYLDMHSTRTIGIDAEIEVEDTTIEVVYSTEEMLLIETDMVRLAADKDARHQLSRRAVDEVIERFDAEIRAAVVRDIRERGGNPEDARGLADEQINAIRHAAMDDNRVSIVQGTAGAGKTFSTKITAQIYKAAGYEVHGLAGGWTQSINLQQAAELDQGRAITGWLMDVEAGRIQLGPKSAVVVDEFGMLSSRQARDILKVASSAGAKVICLGDTKQQHGVGAGDPMRHLVQQLGSARLDEIRRQKDAADKAAVPLFFDGKASEALDTYRERTTFCADRESANAAMVEDWMRSRAAHPPALLATTGKDGQQRYQVQNSHLMLALDNKSVRELNALAHDARKAAGELGRTSVYLRTMDSKSDSDRIEFTEGDEVMFRVNVRKMKAGLGKGAEQGQDYAEAVYNRVTGVIESIDEASSKLRIRTDEGKLVELDPLDKKWQQKDGPGLALQHAYATTSKSAQGLTRDHVFVKDHVGLDARAAGVNMSRHTTSCRLYVDKEARYEAKMARAFSDEWHPLETFTDDECFARMKTSWSNISKKDSTLDFTEWRRASDGTLLHRSVELARHQMSEALEAAQHTPPAAPAVELPFQKSDAYTLPDLEPVDDQRRAQSRRVLADMGIAGSVIVEAERAGFLSQTAEGPAFNGRRADGAVVNRLRNGVAEPGALRTRYCPVLPGDPNEVHLVERGEDALVLWSLRESEGKSKPTIIVAPGGDGRPMLPHLRATVERATTRVSHDREDAAQMAEALHAQQLAKAQSAQQKKRRGLSL